MMQILLQSKKCQEILQYSPLIIKHVWHFGVAPCIVLAACVLGLGNITILAIYRDILKVSISRYFVINYRDTMPVHYCH